MANQPKYVAVTSPFGRAVFPSLNRPDTRFNPAGDYKVDLVNTPEEAADFIAKVEDIRDKFIAGLTQAQQRSLTPKPVFKDELTYPEYPDDATDEEKKAIKDAFVPEPTGNVQFRWKMKAQVTPKSGDSFTQAPVLVFEETGEKVEENIGHGSTLRVKGQVVPYTNAAAGIVGVTLRLKAVQVSELVTGGGDGKFWTDFENDDE